MEGENGEKNADSEVTELRLKVDSLKQELKDCRAELVKLQKQLQQSERLQKSTESYNEDLRKQVDELSNEIHERKRREKERISTETQTEEYVWTETDYYNYYYGSYYDNAETGDTQEQQTVAEADAGQATVDGVNGSQAVEVSTQDETAATDETTTTTTDVTGQPEAIVTDTAEGDAGNIADMLRATAEEALTQTSFVFDETTGMYYDHSTGFYYDSASQLYYDANTGMYYYFDAESGRYQFHSRIEVTAAQSYTEQYQDNSVAEKKSWKFKKGVKKTLNQDDKDLKDITLKQEQSKQVEPQATSHTSDSRKTKRRSRSRDRHLRREESGRSKRKKKHRDGSHESEERSKKKKKKSKSTKKKKRRSPSLSDDHDGNSEPEEGEITESDRGESTASNSSPSASPCRESPEPEMEIQTQTAWPPCVRVTVVRSPVLQVGTLFIITADCPATIGREKDMDHAIRIPEMGVSKFHAEVHFDQEQQSYVLVDQGSQNGTVINGNRILQPKAKSEPHVLMHGDEVKMGETVLSFHIHSGTDTCDGCEPGQVMAHISKYKRDEPTGPALTKEDKEALRQKELKQMKAKYGLQSNEFEETKTLKNQKYKDRAQSRRQTVGSEGVFQRDDAPASVHEEISEVNKGRKMLEKMGWKKGEGLGKEGTGMKNPIELKIRKSQSGLGASAAVSVEAFSMTKSKSQKNWEKARERFADSYQPETLANRPQNNSWVKADEMENTTTGTENQ